MGADGTDSDAVEVIEIDESLYTEDDALNAAYLLGDRFYAQLARHSSGRLVVAFRPSDGQVSVASLRRDFDAALIDASLRVRVATSTADIRQALLTRAFADMAQKHGKG